MFKPLGISAMEVLAKAGAATPALASDQEQKECSPEAERERRGHGNRPAQQALALNGVRLVKARHVRPRRL